MKKLRIIAVILCILLVFSCMVSCDKLSAKSVEKDPAKAVQEGVRLLLQNTPFAALTEESEQTFVELQATAGEESVSVNGALDLAKVQAFLDINAKFEDQDFAGALFLDGKKIAVRHESFTELFGNDVIGLDFGMTKEAFEKSNLYGVLEDLGIWAGLEQAGITDEKLQQVLDLFAEFCAQEIPVTVEVKECAVVAESGKELPAVCVKYVPDAEKVSERSKQLVEDVFEILGISAEDFGLEEYLGALDFDLNCSESYYLSKKSGVLLRVEQESEYSVAGSEEKGSYSFDLTFGEEPEKVFLPSAKYTYTYDDAEVEIVAKSRIEDLKLVTDVTIESDVVEGVVGKLALTVDAEGNFTLKFLEKDGEESGISAQGKLTQVEGGVQISATFNNESESVDVNLDLTLKNKGEMPAMPRFKDLTMLTAEDFAKLEASMEPERDREADLATFAAFVAEYYEIDEMDLQAELAKYASYADLGFTSEAEYLSYLYANSVYEYLYTVYDVPTETMDAALSVEAYSYYDYAVIMNELYSEYVYGISSGGFPFGF
ncbi:MAG: hypothetical protein IKT43_04540 [Clostridia bacterium]|nr:hypothetical protein [Clostridia bacterium]